MTVNNVIISAPELQVSILRAKIATLEVLVQAMHSENFAREVQGFAPAHTNFDAVVADLDALLMKLDTLHT